MSPDLHATVVARTYRAERLREISVIAAIVLAHLAIIGLLIFAIDRSGLLPRKSSLGMSLTNIPDLGSPPSLSPPVMEETIAADVSPPEIDIVVLPPGTDAELGTGNAGDPFAGAAPIVVDSFGSSGRVVVAQPITPAARPVGNVRGPSDPDAGKEFSGWLTDLRQRIASLSNQPKTTSIHLEVYAQPSGGFSNVRVVVGSGDAAVDREIVASVMQHQNLLRPGQVTIAEWFALPPIEISTSNAQSGRSPLPPQIN